MSAPVVDAPAWGRVAREVIGTAYPWSPGHVVTGPQDTSVVPHELHPAFHGALDWHSCVHMQWSLAYARLGREDVVGACRERAVEWFGGDGPASTADEPGGADFPLRGLAEHLPAVADRLRAVAAEQEAAVLPEITDGDFMATHWLVSFGLLAQGDGRAGR